MWIRIDPDNWSPYEMPKGNVLVWNGPSEITVARYDWDSDRWVTPQGLIIGIPEFYQKLPDGPRINEQ